MAGDINNPVPGLYMHKRKATEQELIDDETFLDGQLGFVYPSTLYGKLNGTVFKAAVDPANIVYKDGAGSPFNANIGILANEADAKDTFSGIDCLQVGKFAFLLHALDGSLTYNAYYDAGGNLVKVDNADGSARLRVDDEVIDLLICPSTQAAATGFTSVLNATHKTIKFFTSSVSHVTAAIAGAGEFFRNISDNGRLHIKGDNGMVSRVGNYAADIRMFGASTGASGSANTSAIQDAIDLVESSGEYEAVYIPAGVFNVNAPVYVGSNIKIIGATGATIRADLAQNLIIGNKTGGAIYAGNYNITIDNIVFDCNRTTAGQDITAIGFAHGANINIVNCDFTKWSEWHAIEFNACTYCWVDNCRFYHACAQDLNEEAIQLDIANSFTAFPWQAGAPYDNTPCSKINITNCDFINVGTAIGCHNSAINVTPEHIKIDNCTFKDIVYRCVSAYNWSYLTVTNCSADNVERFVNSYAVNVSGAAIITGIVVSNNVLKNIRYGLNVDADGAVTGHGVIDGIIFNSNVMHNVNKVAGSSRGLWIQGASNSRIINVIADGNTLSVGGQYGITADYGENVIFSNNNVVGCEQTGLVFYTCVNSQMTGNHAKGNGLGGSLLDLRVYNGSTGINVSGGNSIWQAQLDDSGIYATGNSFLTLSTSNSPKVNGNYIANVWTP
jgi:hypothetical protein